MLKQNYNDHKESNEYNDHREKNDHKEKLDLKELVLFLQSLMEMI
jgi:hypothetical protein